MAQIRQIPALIRAACFDFGDRRHNLEIFERFSGTTKHPPQCHGSAESLGSPVLNMAKSATVSRQSQVASSLAGRSDPWLNSGVWIAVGALLFYLLFPNRRFYWDGVGFAAAIEASRGSLAALLHPNHLIYNLLGYAAWRAAAACGLAVRALFVLQTLNALFAAAAVFLVWNILLELTGSTRSSTWGSLIFAFASNWWRFAGDADAYIPSVFFLILSFRLLLPSPRQRLLGAALAHSAAMMFHELAALFFPAAVIMLIGYRRCADKNSRNQGRSRKVISYSSVSLLVTGTAYALAFLLARPHAGLLDFWNWITARAQEAVFMFPPPGALELSIRGTLRLFFGGRVNEIVPGWISAAGALAFGTIIVLLLCTLARSLRKMRRDSFRDFWHPLLSWTGENTAMSVWVISYMVFLYFWQPQNVFYRLFYLPPLLLLLAAAPIWRADRTRFLALIAAAVFVWNFTVSVYPNSRTENNEVLVFAQEHSRELDRGANVLYSNFHTDLWVISYFNPRATWIPEPSPEIGQIEARLLEAEQKGQSLWLEGTVYDALAALPGGPMWLDQHLDRGRSLFHNTPAHKIRFFRLKKDGRAQVPSAPRYAR